MRDLSQVGTSKTLNWRAFGPGILMASAAIGGSHLISSTQAGALYGWQLAIMIILANVFKYPFYHFGTEYAYSTGDSLVVGYAKNHVFTCGFSLFCASCRASSVRVRSPCCVL